MARRSGRGFDLMMGCGIGFALGAILLITVVVIGAFFFNPLDNREAPGTEVVAASGTDAPTGVIEDPDATVLLPTPLPTLAPTAVPTATPLPSATWTPTGTPTPTDTPLPPTPEPTITPAPTPTPLPAPVVVQPVYQIGMDIFATDVRWRILSAQSLGNVLPIVNQSDTVVTTSGKYIQIRFEVENRSSSTQIFAGFSLLDNRGRFFVESTDGAVNARIPDAEQCRSDILNPNVARTCSAIYEVAVDASGLKANVGDLRLLDTQQILVELGL